MLVASVIAPVPVLKVNPELGVYEKVPPPKPVTTGTAVPPLFTQKEAAE